MACRYGVGARVVRRFTVVDLVLALQALIFLLKREFMLIGWMIIYILACVWKRGMDWGGTQLTLL
jgi:hypothetical protein